MSKQDDSSRDRIVAAAIPLFAERGFEGTSVRDITAAANCGVAAVNYHFGGKEKLYEEAFRLLFSEIQERRMAAIKASVAADPDMDLEGFLRSFATAFLEPLIDNNRGALFIAFMAREMSDRLMSPEIFFNEFIRPFMAVSMGELRRLAPPMETNAMLLSLMSVVGQLIHILKVIDIGCHTQLAMPAESIDAYIEHIVRFSAAGIRACASAEPVEV